MRSFRLAILGVAALALTTLAAPVLADQAETMRGVKTAYVSAFSAIAETLEAQQVYSVARASNNENGMFEAAADMLASLSEARYWMAILDQRVTASDFSEEIDKDVAKLSEIVAQAHDEFDDAILSGNLNTVNAAMDKSAKDFNQLFVSVNTVRNKLFPE